ncbi:MAG: hypothetical protein ACOX5R_20370 [bacterium]|jgi:hypothetical protein
MADKLNKTTQNSAGENAGEQKPKLDERFISNIKGKDFCLYAGLLDLAHQMGLQKLEVEQIQIPAPENDFTAICRATAVGKNGEVYSDLGDANPSNVNKMIAPHVLRMASTRAKARALRDFTNIGITCIEELGDLDDVAGQHGNSWNDNNQPEHQPYKYQRKESKNTPRSAVEEHENASSRGRFTKGNEMTDAQKQAVQNLAKRRKLNPTELENLIRTRFSSSLDELDSATAASLIQFLQKSA